jgi:hypothetical protein
MPRTIDANWQTHELVIWGLFDTQEKIWFGDSHGAFQYDDEDLARVAAMMVDKRLGYGFGRTRAMHLDQQANKLRDELPTLMNGEEALRRLEEGL